MSNSVMFFKSPSCPICKSVNPIFDEVASKFKDSVNTEKVDITKDVQKAVDNGVMSVPAILFIKDGNEIERLNGKVSRDNLEKAFERI